MPIVHQDKDFDFSINAEDPDPPIVHIAKRGTNGLLVIRIGIPEKELPHILKYENIDQGSRDQTEIYAR
jgi:hypothetical protein